VPLIEELENGYHDYNNVWLVSHWGRATASCNISQLTKPSGQEDSRKVNRKKPTKVHEGIPRKELQQLSLNDTNPVGQQCMMTLPLLRWKRKYMLHVVKAESFAYTTNSKSGCVAAKFSMES